MNDRVNHTGDNRVNFRVSHKVSYRVNHTGDNRVNHRVSYKVNDRGGSGYICFKR